MDEKQKRVTAFAPATVANVACGFDVLGFAIFGLGDQVTASFSEMPGVSIESISGDDGRLPLSVKDNTAGLAVLSFIDELESQPEQGIMLSIEKQMPLGSGLGSSAASSVAAVVAVNALLGHPFSKKNLLPFAVAGEMAASGEAHADNAAASLLGGFILVKSHRPPDVIDLPTPKKLHCTIIHPDIEIQTKNSRKILKKDVSLEKAVKQWGNLGSLIAALYTEDYDLIADSLHDEIIEPVRSLLIPGFDKMKQAALDAGALGCSISGSGPSLFALSTSRKTAEKIGVEMGNVLKKEGLSFEIHISKMNTEGAQVIKKHNQ